MKRTSRNPIHLTTHTLRRLQTLDLTQVTGGKSGDSGTAPKMSCGGKCNGNGGGGQANHQA